MLLDYILLGIVWQEHGLGVALPRLKVLLRLAQRRDEFRVGVAGVKFVVVVLLDCSDISRFTHPAGDESWDCLVCPRQRRSGLGGGYDPVSFLGLGTANLEASTSSSQVLLVPQLTAQERH